MDLSKYKIPESKSKAKFEYQSLGEEIRDYFKVPTKSFWWIFYKVEIHKIREAFKDCVTGGITDIGKFISYSKNKK